MKLHMKSKYSWPQPKTKFLTISYKASFQVSTRYFENKDSFIWEKLKLCTKEKGGFLCNKT